MATVNFSVPDDVKAAFDAGVRRRKQERGARRLDARSRRTEAPTRTTSRSLSRVPGRTPQEDPTGDQRRHPARTSIRTTVRAALDASVVVKWLLRADDRERDVDAALAVFDAIAMGTIEPLQPPHWLAEVAAVLARLTPDRAAATAQATLCDGVSRFRRARASTSKHVASLIDSTITCSTRSTTRSRAASPTRCASLPTRRTTERRMPSADWSSCETSTCIDDFGCRSGVDTPPAVCDRCVMPYAPFDLSGKVALVTGGNSGIGLGMAEALAQAGARRLHLGDQRRQERRRRSATLAAHGTRVHGARLRRRRRARGRARVRGDACRARPRRRVLRQRRDRRVDAVRRHDDRRVAARAARQPRRRLLHAASRRPPHGGARRRRLARGHQQSRRDRGTGARRALRRDQGRGDRDDPRARRPSTRGTASAPTPSCRAGSRPR